MGESYHKWDAQNQYYPTIIFLFCEDKNSKRGHSILRKSQIKIRLKHSQEDFTATPYGELEGRLRDSESVYPLKNSRYTLSYGVIRVCRFTSICW